MKLFVTNYLHSFQERSQLSAEIDILKPQIRDLERRIRAMKRRYDHLESELAYASDVDKENESPWRSYVDINQQML